MNTDKINAITETILDNIHDDTLMEILQNKLDCKGIFHGYCIRGLVKATF